MGIDKYITIHSVALHAEHYLCVTLSLSGTYPPPNYLIIK